MADRQKLGMEVVSGYKQDKEANADRFERIRKIMTYVFDTPDNYADSSVGGYVLPLLMTAAIDFNAIAYPAVLNDGEPVKCSYYGEDEQGLKNGMAELYSNFGSWQLCSDVEHWKEDLDKMFMMLPTVGCLFKKVYPRGYSRDVSSDLILPYQLVVHPSVKTLKEAPRVTHVVEYERHQVISKIRSGEWEDVKIEDFVVSNPIVEKLTEESEAKNMGDASPLVFLEQHLRYDWDEDGYPEPIIVTVHEGSGKVVKVEKNYIDEVMGEDGLIMAEPIQYFVKYGFLRDPAGSFYDIGFGQVFYENMAAVNAAVSMLLDAGQRANLHTGLIGKGGVRMKGGELKLEMGKFAFVESYGDNLKNNIIEFENKEPSQVLFSLLGYMVSFIEKTTSMQNSLFADGANGQKATTTLTLVEQGMQQYKAVLHRVRDSLDKEINLMLRFNTVAFRKPNPFDIDFTEWDENIFYLQPTFDINNLTSSIRLSKAQVMVEMSNTNLASEIDAREVIREVFAGLKIGNPDRFLSKQEPTEPEIMLQLEQEKNNGVYAQLELQKEQNKAMELQLKARESEVKVEKMKKEIDKIEADIDNTDANTVKTLAEARDNGTERNGNNTGV